MLSRIASRLGLKADRIERFITLARAAMVWERVWPALWPASGILGLYLAAALFDVFAHIPGWLHAVLFLTALGGTAAALYLRFRDMRLPDWREGARRLERDSTLAHRPITERDDTLAAGRGDSWAEALWRAHVKRLLASIDGLHVRWPAPGLAGRDPHALRFVVLVVLVAGFAVAGQDWNRRLATAFLPAIGGGATPSLDAWINPPAYTGEAPVYLQSTPGSGGTLAVPAGSQLVLRVHGARGMPGLRIDPPLKKSAAFTGGSSEYAADIALTNTANIAVRAGGRTLGRWQIKAVADTPPVIAFSAPPARTERNAMKLAFAAGDDYGVAKVRAIIVPLKSENKTRKPLVIELPVDNPSARTLQQTAYKDLTEHPYAGLKVTITLEATDGAGQTGKSKPVQFTLPARVFTNPLARALVEQRQDLAVGDVAAVPKAQRTLDALTIAPERFYSDKTGVYTAIRAAYWGLRTARAREDIARVQDLLWQTAVALEEGGLSSAAEMLRQLQEMLSQALASGAPQETIEELLQRYRQALDKYLQLLAQNPQQGSQPLPPNAKVLNPQDLQDLLNAIQQLAQTGARGQAAQMLAMLQSLLENLHMSAGNGQGGQSPGDKATSDAVKKLGDLMGRQRDLLDKTYRQGQGAGDPKDGGAKGLSQNQGKLREDLDKVLKGLGAQGVPPPKSLGDAGRSMGEAQGDLGQKDFDHAGDAQKEALEAMRKGAGQLAQKLMQGTQQGMQDANQDPFGRSEGGRGMTFGGNVKVPDKSTLERAREILKELRKRAAERGRPKEELDYIDRLLKQF